MLIGFEKQKKYFLNVIKDDGLSHAYFFSGQEMIGKRTFAFYLASRLLGDNFEQNPDFKFITPRISEGESKIYIEDVRDLKTFFSFRNYNAGPRVVIINDAHRLTIEAVNAFLKILEEPPAGSLIILISSMPGLLPATILSRCEEVGFVPPEDKDVIEALSSYKNIGKEDRDFIVKLTGGRVGLAKLLIEEGGLSDARKSIEDLRTILNKGIFEKMEYAKKLYDSGKYPASIGYWLYWVSSHLSVSPKNEKIVKELLSLNHTISQPQFNHRLALENFLLSI